MDGRICRISDCKYLKLINFFFFPDLEEKRFRTVGHYSLVWELRNQPPVEHGTADISTVLTATLTAEEVEKIKVISFLESLSWLLSCQLGFGLTFMVDMVAELDFVGQPNCC